MAIAVSLPPEGIAIKHVVLSFSTFAAPFFKIANGESTLSASLPWVRTASALNDQGIAVAFTDMPSDSNHRPTQNRPLELKNDLRKAVQYLETKYPLAAIHLGGYSQGATSTLDILGKIGDTGKAVIVSGAFSNARDMHWQNSSNQVMLVHAPSAQCDSSPFVEAEIVARQNHFKLVIAGYEKQESRASCGDRTQSRLTGLDQDFAKLVANWLNNEEVASYIGHASPQIAWRDRIVHYTFGSHQMEMSLMLPDGPGPFPVAVFNHGDVLPDTVYTKYKTRYVDMVVAREFLQQGIAVAFPCRLGVGMSEGIYPFFNKLAEADASYNARIQTSAIMPAVDYLRKEKEIDANKIIIVGQSAGGFATMYIASQNPPGVIGAISFAGARSDNPSDGPPNYRNPIMIDAHAEFGKTARIPVLMIYAEHDSRTTPNTIRLSHEAFVQSGGTATLVLVEQQSMDGHFIHRYPSFWHDALLRYLREIKVI